ncbi:hypothetical protein GXW82_43345 [Streptacidiphilus sp. 4-A2]|nr:hypothetical protein [Streptacidiphilus sp. 4-A2]
MASGRNQSRVFGDRRGASRRSGTALRSLAAVFTVVALTMGTAQAAPVAHSQSRTPAVMARTASIPVAPVVSHYQKPHPMAGVRIQPPVWPTGTSTVTLPVSATAGMADQAVAQGHGAAAPTAARAGALPVWIGSPAGNPGGAAARSASAATPSKVSVRVLPRAAAQAAESAGCC